MFFLLSKTISIVLMPVTILFIVFVTAYFLKDAKRKRNLLLSGVVLFFVFTNDFIANELMLAWEIPTVAYKDLKPHEVGIVLTGSTVPFLTPNDRVYFSRGADRVTHTVELYKLGLIKKILISGGSGRLVGEDEPEANKFQRAMVMMGVADTDIWIENETRNTHESALAVRVMMDTLMIKPESCLLITSAFHMRRSLACYEKVDLNIEPFTTDFYTHPRRFTFDVFLPRLEGLVKWQKLIREWVGMLAYKMAGYV
jgi:uncharacterized SAM-binding protein YcdF (DUF218 family)